MKELKTNFRIIGCNIIQHCESTEQKNVIDYIKMLNDERNEHKDEDLFVPIFIDGCELQQAVFNIENKINRFFDANSDLTEQGVQKYEIKEMLISQYLLNVMAKKISEENLDFRSTIGQKELSAIDEGINFFDGDKDDFDIIGQIEKDSLFYHSSNMYNYIRKSSEKRQLFVNATIINGENIEDLCLQNCVNMYMSNQRSGVFSLNFLTSKEIISRNYNDFFLQRVHDVEIINLNNQGYAKKIKRNKYESTDN